MRTDVAAFCARIGSDPLLVQAGGGNVSWKDGEILHVKASGVWLADALNRPIFVAVDLAALRNAFCVGDYDAATRAAPQDGMRSSIETALHALMPHRLVVHVHAVEALTHLVRRDCAERLRTLLGDGDDWGLVPYCKPGADLARGVARLLHAKPNVRTIFLQNHGIVMGGDSVPTVETQLFDLCARLKSQVWSEDMISTAALPALNALTPHDDPRVHVLARDPAMFDRIEQNWALYPDHIVFLGPRPHCIDPGEKTEGDIVFVRGLGVYGKRALTPSEAAYLNCYAEVFRRLPLNADLSSLTQLQVAELLSWDLEKFRQNTARDRSGSI